MYVGWPDWFSEVDSVAPVNGLSGLAPPACGGGGIANTGAFVCPPIG